MQKDNGKDNFNNNIRLSSKKPSPSILATSHNLAHWKIPRTLTYREIKRLGSFPDDYQAKTDKIGKYMIGMSVPPKMMQKVAEAVISQWF